MIIEAFLISIILGLVRRGSVRNLARLPLRHTFLFILPLLLFGVIAAVARGNPALKPFARAGNMAQYLVMLTAIMLNLHIREMLIAGFGTFLNFLALAVNNGMMPVSLNALRIAGMPNALTSDAVRHVAVTPETRLKWLTDVIPVPLGHPCLSEVASVGDALVAVAIFLLIQHYMCALSPVKEPSAGE